MTAKECEENIRKNMLRYMAIRQKTQTDLSHNTGISYGTVGRWLSGKSLPTIENIGKMADYFGVTFEEMIFPVGQSPNKSGLKETIYGDFVHDVFGPEFRAEITPDFMNRVDSLLWQYLAPNEESIVRKVHGLDMDGVKSFAEIGREMGYSREYVRQIYDKAVRILARDGAQYIHGTINETDPDMIPIEDARGMLGPRAYNAIISDGRIRTLGDLISMDDSDLLTIESFGPASLRYVDRVRAVYA